MEELIKTRLMTKDDINAVVAIYTEAFDVPYISFGELAAGQAESPCQISPQASELFQQELEELINDLEAGLFVATLNSNIIGFAVATLNKTKAGHFECWLEDLGISPQFRRQGTAKNIVKEVLNWGTQKGAKYFLLESGIHNEAAHQLFENLGFQPLATVFWHN